jgi:hypothetical protein
MEDRASDGASEPDSRIRSLLRYLLARLADVNMWVVMGVGFALGLLAIWADYSVIAVLCFLLAGLLPTINQTFGPEDEEEEGYPVEMTTRERMVYLLAVFRWAFTPWGIYTQFLQIGGTLAAYARYRGDVPSTERHTPDTELCLSFDGEWTAVNGGVTESTSHSWGLLAQRYAYDFVVTDEEGETHAGDGENLDDYYAFGQPVRAPAEGTVIAVNDGRRDYPKPGSAWIEWRTWDIAGNHVTIKHGPGEFSFLAHLQRGSTTVAEGETVEVGDPVGRCGNSGHSSEPHLHYQLQDTASFWSAAGLAPSFFGIKIERADEKASRHEPYANRTSGEGVYLWAGDRVKEVVEQG